jgi:hypothetical protein
MIEACKKGIPNYVRGVRAGWEIPLRETCATSATLLRRPKITSLRLLGALPGALMDARETPP